MDVEWKDVKVGQVLKVMDNELFPADLLCLHSSLPENVCFIKTTNLVRCWAPTLGSTADKRWYQHKCNKQQHFCVCVATCA